MKISYPVALAAIALTVSLTACDGGGGTPTVTVTGPVASPSTSPAVTPVVTPSPTPGHWYTLDETWDLAAPDQAQGSGCAPGPGLLPDGVWFGRAESWSTTQISFDMECWWTGAEAEAQAAARGEEAYDYYITNDSTTIRLVTIASDAFALKADVLNISDTSTWVAHTMAEVIADPGGSMPVAPTPIVWIAVNGGVVTALAVQYVP